MKILIAASFWACFIILLVSAEECDYTMKKMCDIFSPNATYSELACSYTCRIKDEFEVFTGAKPNGTPCKSIVGNKEGVCKKGLCRYNQ